MPFKKPEAVFIALDDTLISFSVPREEYWNTVTTQYESSFAPVSAKQLTNLIIQRGDWFWGQNGKNMKWRLHLREARRQIVYLALEDSNIRDMNLANRIADDFSDLREKGENRMRLVPGSVDTLKYLKSKDIKLALLTNGGARCQRDKVEQFNLGQYFNGIYIEGELGYGKPDPRVYNKAISDLGVKNESTWMIGDNPLWDVAAPQKLGLKGVYVNLSRSAPPENLNPFLTIEALPEIRNYIV